MKKFVIVAAAAALLTGPALAQDANPPGQDRDCLITWATPEDAATEADAKALSGKYLPRSAADAQAAASGGTARVYDYSNTTQYGVDITNNDQEQSFCEGPTFNPTSDNGGNGKATGNPAVGNPGNDKNVGNAGENPSGKDNAGGNGNGNPGVGNPGNDKNVGNAGENPSENNNAGGNGNGKNK